VSTDKPSGPPPESPSERRAASRHSISLSVDCETPETFLYASISNISELGIFVETLDPFPVGTRMTLRFTPQGEEPFVLEGVVQWINAVREGYENPNPGMGVRFLALEPEHRERLIEVVRTIAYLREAGPSRSN
jgi:type IV pilus assembly protein PilZ